MNTLINFVKKIIELNEFNFKSIVDQTTKINSSLLVIAETVSKLTIVVNNHNILLSEVANQQAEIMYHLKKSSPVKDKKSVETKPN